MQSGTKPNVVPIAPHDDVSVALVVYLFVCHSGNAAVSGDNLACIAIMYLLQHWVQC